MEHKFFQGFIPQQGMAQKGTNLTPEFSRNLMVMELYNNWKYVIEMIKRTEEHEEIQVDPLEMDWINFINQNKINIKSYETNEDFIEIYLKPLVKDK